MEAYIWVKTSAFVDGGDKYRLVCLRFFWKWRNSAMMKRRWVKITPHVNDTVSVRYAVSRLVMFTHFYPLWAGTWLTEKLFGVIIYVLLGYVALSKTTT
jgi:uncharacterized membrane protein SirB2